MPDREQSPHYIPELDPANKDRPSATGERMFLWLEYLRYIAFFISVIVAAVAWFNGWEEVFFAAVVASFIFGASLVLSMLA